MNVSRLFLLTTIVLGMVLPEAWGRCSIPRPVGETAPGAREVPSDLPESPVSPPDTPADEEPPTESEPPPDVDGDTPATDDPRPPPSAPAAPGGTGGLRRPTSPGGARSPSGMNYAGAWRIWWELSREHLIGLRGTLVGQEPTSGEIVGDPEMRRRLSARAALRDLAANSKDPALRSVALRALGRVGDDEDARFLFLVMRSKSAPDEVLEGAAIGLASLQHVGDPELRAELRKFFDRILRNEVPLPNRTRLLTILAISMRARDDAALVRSLGGMLGRKSAGSSEAAALLYACGITKDRMLSAELCSALETGEVGSRSLHDVARAHAAMGLALSAEPGTVSALSSVLFERKTGVHTRRAAIIALGVLLRNGELEGDRLDRARKAVHQAFKDDRDPLVMGYSLIAMGTAREPFGLDILVKTVDKTGSAVAKPFAALALGSAALRLDEKLAAKARGLLVAELSKNRDPELAGALSIAVGLSRAAESKKLLLARARDDKLNPSIRGPACEALGLLGTTDPEAIATLTKLLDLDSREVVEDAAIALGLIGRPETARLLVAKMVTTKSKPVREHMVVALSHLGGVAAIEPLLKVVKDSTLKPAVRESAAEALGVLLDPREVDPLFELDATCNPYGLTDATRELIRIY